MRREEHQIFLDNLSTRETIENSVHLKMLEDNLTTV
jgi:hypothetical protein